MTGATAKSRFTRPASVQMRPVLMTCIAAAVGLLPAAFSTAIGSQVQRPLAIVVVGGTLLAPLLFLTVLPAAIAAVLAARASSSRRPTLTTARGGNMMRRSLSAALRSWRRGVLAGCSVGPDFVSPEGPKTADLCSGPEEQP